MARLPIQIERVGLTTPRERMWQTVRKLRAGFTCQQLQEAADRPMLSLDAIQEYLVQLEQSGHIRRKAKQVRKQHRFDHVTFELVTDSFDAPRVDAAGRAVTQGIKTLAMWRAMKVLKDFDYRDIQRAASLGTACQVTPLTAKSYVVLLARANYFRTLQAAKGSTPARYRLVRDTGAHAPAITRRKAVFDRNSGEFTWQQSAQEVCDGLE